mmetsp:Transcript_7835/g.17330  ORF Transcript_7835/g.17330 Transcript_7835/m.17330 type:complete len:225 (-) Transcript_7835:781-1455(-)
MQALDYRLFPRVEAGELDINQNHDAVDQPSEPRRGLHLVVGALGAARLDYRRELLYLDSAGAINVEKFDKAVHLRGRQPLLALVHCHFQEVLEFALVQRPALVDIHLVETRPDLLLEGIQFWILARVCEEEAHCLEDVRHPLLGRVVNSEELGGLDEERAVGAAWRVLQGEVHLRVIRNKACLRREMACVIRSNVSDKKRGVFLKTPGVFAERQPGVRWMRRGQ